MPPLTGVPLMELHQRRYVMTSRTMTGSVLVAGPIGIMVSWLGWSALVGNPDSADHAAMIAAVSQNPETTKWLLGLAGLFSLFMATGLGGLRNSMPGGQGSDYVSMGVLIVTMAITAGLGEIALTIAAGEVGATGNTAVATTIYLAGNGIGVISTAAIFTGFIAIGLGIYIEKNFNQIIAGLLLIASLSGLVMTLYDYGSQLLIIGYMGMSLSVVALCVSMLRSSY